MAKASLEQIKSIAVSAVDASKIAIDTFNVTRDNIAGLVDKIGLIVTIDTAFTIDKLNMFDGMYLEYGKSIEEWQEDLILPVAYDSTGANALSPHDPTFRPASYSYTLGRKLIATTIRNNNIERAVHNQQEFANLLAMQTKRLQDSMAQYRYAMKRQMIAVLYSKATASASQTITSASSASKTWSVNDIIAINITGNSLNGKYVAVKAASAVTDTPANFVANGYLIKLDLVTELAQPSDSSTGEAWIKQIKKDLEVASDVSESHSLNGNTLGATDSLVLVVKQGVIPEVEVDTYAGAFNRGDVAIPAELVVVKDFGNCDSSVYAVLLDKRGMRLHNTYSAVRDNVNGEGDFLNLFQHTEDTAFLSRNTFVKFYKSV